MTVKTIMIFECDSCNAQYTQVSENIVDANILYHLDEDEHDTEFEHTVQIPPGWVLDYSGLYCPNHEA